MSTQMETAVHSYDEKYLLTRSAASYSPGEYMGTGVTSDGFGFVVTDAVGLFCNSTISAGSGTPNLIGTSTQMVLAVNNLHNGDWLDINGHVWFGGQQCGNPYITGTNVYGAYLDSAGTDETFTTIANGWNANDGEEGYTIGVTTTGKLMICGDTRNGARGNGTAGADLQKWVQIPLATNIVPRKVYAGFAQFVICDTTTSGGTVIGQRIYSWSTTIGHASSLGYGSPSFGAGASSISTYNVPTEILIGGQHAHNILCIAGGLDCNYMLFDSAISGRADSVRILAWGTYGWRMCHTTVAGGTDPLNTPTDITAKIMTPTVIAAASSHTIDTVVVDNGSSHILIGDGSIRVLVGWGSSEQGTLGNGMQLNFATTSTPYNDGGQDEYLGAVVQMTPVIICPTKANWKTLTSTMYYGYFNQYGDQNGNWFFCGRYKTYVAPLGVHSADFTTGNLSSVMNCGWIFSNFVQQYDAFANTAALSIGQGCSNACVSGPTSNSQCSAISVTCSAIHAGVSVTSSGTTAYLTGASSTYGGTRLMHMKFYIDGVAAPNIMDNPVTQTDTAKGLSSGSHTAKVVIIGQYYEADSATFSFTISSQTSFWVSGAGNDANVGTQGSPFLTTSKAVSSATAIGDSIMLHNGYTYTTTGITVSYNSFFIGTWGTGAKAAISGTSTMTFGNNDGGGIYSAYCAGCTSALNMVLVSDTPRQMGRYPNSGWLPISAITGGGSPNVTITGLTGSWNGANAVLRDERFCIDNIGIISQTGTLLGLASAPAYTNGHGNGAFITNSLATLDSLYEWYLNPATDSLYMFFGSAGPGSLLVQTTTTSYTISASGRNTLTIAGIDFEGSNLATFLFNNDSNVSILACTINNCGTNSILGNNSQNLLISGCHSDWVNNIWFYETGSSTNNTVVTYDTIYHVGMFAGMGASGGGGTYEAVNSQFGTNTINNNKTKWTGYIPIFTGGANTQVLHNDIDSFCRIKDDGGGIYFHDASLTAWGTYRLIAYNYIHNGICIPGGVVYDSSSSVNGIYDDGSTSWTILDSNFIQHVTSNGIFIHGPTNTLRYNQVYDAQYAQVLISEFTGGPVIVGIQMRFNALAAATSIERALAFITVNNDLGTYGSIDSNQYSNPGGVNIFYTSTTAGIFYRTLAGWRIYVSYDLVSGLYNAVPFVQFNPTLAPLNWMLYYQYQDYYGTPYSGGSTVPPTSGRLLLQGGNPWIRGRRGGKHYYFN